MENRELFVTKPSLPPLSDFISCMESIWESGQLTNCGPFHQGFERALSEHLGVPFVSLFANGTLALVVALKVLGVSGEVITTPYSFVATSHALLWNNISPVFVDIERNSFNVCPDRIASAITERTSAILPVHCYGNPCQVELLQEIADEHGLKIIYDAAHAFGIEYKGQSLLNYGDLSVLSFHATKVFNTFEGGAIVCRDEKTKAKIDLLKNFGFVDEATVAALGVNGKMNEFQAALGLMQLKYIDGYIADRKRVYGLYKAMLPGLAGIRVVDFCGEASRNYSYFPVLVEGDFGPSRDDLYWWLKKVGVNARRYFYPLISDFPMYRDFNSSEPDNLPIAHDVAARVLCLPIYPGLSDSDVSRVLSEIRECQCHFIRKLS